MSTSPTKRRRKEVEASPERISIDRHNSLYFENGNIVLFSPPKDNVVTAFKVYKDLLSLNSHVFEGMLSLPPHPDVEKYDDVPLVRLPDEAADLIPFLSAIYHPTDIPSRRDFYVTYDKVESVFKLSKKYECDTLYKCMKDTLLEIWPLDLRAWDRFVNNKKPREKRENYNRDKEGQEGDSDDPNDNSGEDNDPGANQSLGLQTYELNPTSVLPDPCSAIQLAREYDVPQILPAAFYHLFCILPDAFSDTGPEDGDHWGRLNSPFGSLANFTLLSSCDVMCFVRGSYAIRKFPNEFKSKLDAYITRYVENADACRSSTTIQECPGTLRSFGREDMDKATLHGDLLEILRISEDRGNLYFTVCVQCANLYIRFVGNTRSHIWESLPEIFAL